MIHLRQMPATTNAFPMPNPPTAQPGQPPQLGQWAEYLAEDGQITPCIITGVYNLVGWSVTAVRVKPAEGRQACPFEYGGWKYDIATGRVLYDPCVPPGEKDPDQSQEPDGDRDDS